MMQPPENKIGVCGGGNNSKAITKKTNNVFTFKKRLDILTGEDTTTVVSPNTVKGWDIFEVRAAVNLHYGGNVQLRGEKKEQVQKEAERLKSEEEDMMIYKSKKKRMVEENNGDKKDSKKTRSVAAGYQKSMIHNKIHIGLFIFHWLFLGNLVIPKALSSISTLQQFTSSSADGNDNNIYIHNLLLREIISATLWIGFILAISGMEAWLKFHAPFCPREYALDIGRTISPALNAVECAFCVTCWQQHFSRRRLILDASSSVWELLLRRTMPASLLLVTLILASDVLWLTPKLVRRGKRVVYQYLKAEGKRETLASSKEFVLLEKEMKMSQNITISKGDKTHVLYVALECIKLLILGRLVVSSASSLPSLV